MVSFLFLAARIPVNVSEKTTNITNNKNPLMGMKNEATKPQQILNDINSQP
jgi:hypothetical protein